MWDARESLSGLYDWASFTLANGQTNYDVAANQSELFYKIKVARRVTIETSKDITARFNRTSLPAINIDYGASPVEFKNIIEVRNIYLTNASGADSIVRILLA